VIVGLLRPGALLIFHVQGVASDAARRRSIELMGQEVLPAIREFATSIGVVDPFSVPPGGRRLATGAGRSAVVDRAYLQGAASERTARTLLV
jgi:hypothetical protein